MNVRLVAGVVVLLVALLAIAACPARQAQAAPEDFVFPRSSYQLLAYEDLRGLSAYDLYLARNEIFARHGYIFVSPDLRERFTGMDWYTALYTEVQFSWELLNQIEQSNIALIQEQEAVLRGEIQGVFGDDASRRIATAYFDFVLPEYWSGYTDVLYDYQAGAVVSVAYRGNPDMPLVWFKVVDSRGTVAQGDSASALVAWWDNGRGQRIELWGRNYVYLTKLAAANSVAYPYPNAVVEAALVDLSTGGAKTVDSARLQYSTSLDGFGYYWDAIVPGVTIR